MVVRTIEEICKHIKEAKRYCLQQFHSTDVLNPEFFEQNDSAYVNEELEMFRNIALENVQECLVR